MKKFVLAFTFLAAFAAPTLAHAALWTDGVNADIASGKLDDINKIVAANPSSTGDIAIYMMQQAQTLLTTNPDKAANVFAATAPYITQVSQKSLGQVVKSVRSFLDAARELASHESSCYGASAIYSSALSMTASPAVVAYAPTLHANAVDGARDAIKANTSCDNKTLNDEVELAELPQSAPVNNLSGAVVPSNQ